MLPIDHGRNQKRDKRGGGAHPDSLDDLLVASKTGGVQVEDLLTLEDALAHLEAVDARAWLKRELSGQQSATSDK